MAYAKIDKSILYSNELTSDEKVALFALTDRLSLSMTKGNMYMRNGHYFVKFSQLEMATVVGKSARKIFDVYKHLEELGIIRRKKNRNASDDIFLLGFAESASSNSQELQTSKHYSNKNNNTVTVDTKRPFQNRISNLKTRSERKNVSIEHKKTFPKQKKSIQNLKTALIEQTKLPENAVDEVIKFANHDYDKAYELFGIINQAKYYVAKQNDLLGNPVASYEHNKNIQSKIAWKLNYLFKYARNVKKVNGYLMNGLKAFFLDAFGLVKDELIEPIAQSQLKTIDRKKPAWMDEEYDPEKDKLSDESKQEVQRLLEEFYAR